MDISIREQWLLYVHTLPVHGTGSALPFSDHDTRMYYSMKKVVAFLRLYATNGEASDTNTELLSKCLLLLIVPYPHSVSMPQLQQPPI